MEVRRIQKGTSSCYVYLPTQFLEELELAAGDVVAVELIVTRRSIRIRGIGDACPGKKRRSET